MNFLNRLKYYLIGVGLGILVVLAIFKDRNLTAWTPENQVLNSISKYDMEINDEMTAKLNCLSLDRSKLKSLLAEGDVNFDKSKVRDGKQKIYHLDLEGTDITAVEIELRDSLVILNAVFSEKCN